MQEVRLKQPKRLSMTSNRYDLMVYQNVYTGLAWRSNYMKIVAAAFVCLGLGSAVFAQSGVNFDFGARAGVPVSKPLSQSETGLFNGVPCCGRSTDSVARTFEPSLSGQHWASLFLTECV
jgi:hypothetical protein